MHEFIDVVVTALCGSFDDYCGYEGIFILVVHLANSAYLQLGARTLEDQHHSACCSWQAELLTRYIFLSHCIPLTFRLCYRSSEM